MKDCLKKYSISLLFSFLLTTTNLFAQDRSAVHGMVVMGTSQIYASHLPMFHSPHDYQIILELKFDQKSKEIYEKAYQASEKKFFTLEPEKFVLPDMLKKPKNFKANLYEGHFERGGIKIAENVEISIVEVIYSQKLNAKLGLKTINFLVFGNEKEQFMAHFITVKPDFDQIFSIQCSLKDFGKKQKYWRISLPDVPNSAFKKEKVTGVFETKWVKLEQINEIYLEFDDLK